MYAKWCMGILYKHIGVGSALLVLDWMGKCQSLKRWNGQQGRISTLFCIIVNINAFILAGIVEGIDKNKCKNVLAWKASLPVSPTNKIHNY